MWPQGTDLADPPVHATEPIPLLPALDACLPGKTEDLGEDLCLGTVEL